MHFASKISAKPGLGLRVKTFSVLLLVFVLVIQECSAQLSDDFNDGNLSENPAWNGTVDDFIVNGEGQLQLSAEVAGSSWLSAEMSSSPGQAIEWQIFLRQSFAPSGSNYGRYYLISDQRDLSLPLNGYFLQFGEAGSNDAVELFRQSGTTLSSVCRGTASKIASSFALRAKVIRYDPGLWELYIDYTGGYNFALEASGSDDGSITSGHIGFRCTYTITNATRFYMDDVFVQFFSLPDSTPPQLRSLQVLSANTLKLNFDEALDASNVTTESFYVTPSGGFATAVNVDDEGRAVIVSFRDAFANGVGSRLKIVGLTDLSGNAIQPLELTFLHFTESPVAFRDIVLSEIYADPTPSRDLPEAEYVELFNRSANPVNLRGWILSDGTTAGLLDSVLMLPGQYLLLTPKGSSLKYPSVSVLALPSFPSLNNSGDALRLNDDEGKLIDSVKYDLEWYNDSEKQDGGWSLELIDIENICDDKANWTSSDAPEGGTPGFKNSVAASRPDNMGPELKSISVEAPSTITLLFTEKLHPVLPRVDQVSIHPPLTVETMALDETRTKISLLFREEIASGMEYALTISNVYDCPGNVIKDNARGGTFLLPETAEPLDVIINEILFNPRPTGVDYVELFNRSDKTIDLKDWSIRNASSKSVILTNENLLLRTGEYCVLTPNAQLLKGEYVAGVEQTFRNLELPPLNDGEGVVILVRDDGVIIDSVFYSEEMHSPFVNDDEGISLERISSVDNGVSNWTSASSTSGFGTPGYANSSARGYPPGPGNAIVVSPEIIRLDTYSDFAQIHYHFDRGGFMANVRIYDHQGRSIREIASNELLASDGFFRWDGDRDDGMAAASGYYMLWFEVFDDAGSVSTFRRRIAIH